MAKVALLIGVSEYEVGLNPLPAAVKDVVALERILKDSEMGDFDEVKILTNPEPQAMQYEVETLFSGRSKDDFVLLFFSGHGIKDDSNNLYFATRITKKSAKGDLIRSTAVPARFVHEVMNNSRAKRQAIILDCCFSGAFDPNLQSKDDGSVDLQGQLGAEGRVVLTSSSSTQYSFEQQGSDLSLYTRYLIEGIETGAGDRDEDGKISVRELHEYATSKVQETAPSMTPKLITLKDLGFDLVLAKAKVTDPSLRYRRQVEKYSSRGAISSIGRSILDRLQIQLGLSAQVAKEIESEVLRPYQERLDNIQRYQQAFENSVKHEYPLSRYVLSELEDLLEILGLRREDVDAIEKEIIAKQSGSVKTSRTEPPKVQTQHRKENTSPPPSNSRSEPPKVDSQYRKEKIPQSQNNSRTEPPKVDPQYRKESTSQSQNNSRTEPPKVDPQYRKESTSQSQNNSRTEPPKVDPQYRKENTSPSPNNSRVQESEVSEAQDTDVIRYAGFWRRSFAFLVDALISFWVWVGGATLAMNIISGGRGETIDWILGVISISLYHTFFEISPLRATIGKVMCSLRVSDVYGKKIGFFKSLFRNILKMGSIACFGIGILHLLVSLLNTKKKQGVHDLMMGTVVVLKEEE